MGINGNKPSNAVVVENNFECECVIGFREGGVKKK
jgi:hypothetical protein